MTGRPRVAIAGAGRAGSALAAALRRARFEITLWDRHPAAARRAARAARARSTGSLARLLARGEILLLAVSDDALGEAARAAAADWPARGGPGVALHLAGARPASELAALAARGASPGVLHPVVALQGARSAGALRGRFATVSGERRALAAARRLARAVGLRPLTVEDEARPLVHLAAVMAAGDVVTLLAAAEELLRTGGIARGPARRLLASLAESAVAGFRGAGLPALTGPLPRGDAETVRRHLAALDLASDAAAAHVALAALAVDRLEEAGRLRPEAARKLRRALRRPMARGRRAGQDRGR